MAQIVTITNPLTGQPAQVDQLDHTAQQIDDAIARALPGGAIDTALQNKAPSGYGLGTYGRPLGANDDLNNITKNGWYCWSSNLPANAITPWSAMFVNVVNDGHIVQTIYPFSMPGTRIIRVCTGSIWKPDEYENPPMLLGKEYRTTERSEGKPVYCKRISYIPENSISGNVDIEVPHNISNFGAIVRITGHVGPYTIPYFSNDGKFTAVRAVDSANIVIANYGASWNSGSYWYFYIYYTKTEV